MEFLPDSGHAVPGESRESTTKGVRTLAELPEQFDVHPNQITSRKAQLEGGAADVFGPGGGNGAPPAIDVKSLPSPEFATQTFLLPLS